jgi:hypothetical protein
MAGICFSSLALLGGTLGLFGVSWYRTKQNKRKQKKIVKEEEEQQINELTAK